MGDANSNGRPINTPSVGGNPYAQKAFSGAQLGDTGSDIRYMGNQFGLGALDQQQSAYADMLRRQIAGQGPSLAQGQFQQATDQNARMAASSIASQRGLNSGMAARGIMNAQNQIGQQAAGQSALLRSGEQMQATGMLGGALAQQRSQQLGQVGTLGNISLGQNDLNLRNALGTQGLNQQNSQFYAGMQNQNQQHSDDRLWNLAGGVLNSAGAVATHLKTGGMVKGPASAGDNIPIKATAGEIVLPLSVTKSPDAPEKAAAFVKAIRGKHYAKGGEVESQPHYGHLMAKLRESDKRIKALEQKLGGEK